MGIESFKKQNNEKEQTKEEIGAILKQALENGLFVDLVISDPDGKSNYTPYLIVEEIKDNDLIMTYLAEDGKIGESIPLDLARIKKAVINKKIQT